MLCRMSLFIFFPCVAMSLFIDLDVTFFSFYKSPRRTSTTFKVAVSHFVFTHLEPSDWLLFVCLISLYIHNWMLYFIFVVIA